jgi:aryl-alcohol dehydrogenase-like predicted oxidoreductase
MDGNATIGKSNHRHTIAIVGLPVPSPPPASVRGPSAAIGNSGGVQDDAQSVAAVHRALELDVNRIDTAAVYGLGHSEEVVARALQEWQGPRPYVFTKFGMIWKPGQGGLLTTPGIHSGELA